MSKSVASADFSVFWEQYPRKIARLDALKAWMQLKPSAALIVTIMDALEQHKVQPMWRDKSFVPYAATWIRGRRWEDELEPARTEHWSKDCHHDPPCGTWMWHEARLMKESA